MAENIFEIAYIVLGVITLFLGGFLPDRFYLPQKTRYIVLEEEKYMRHCRLLLYVMGGYYLVLGIVLFIITNEPNNMMYFKVIIPNVIYIPLLFLWRKHLRPLRKDL